MVLYQLETTNQIFEQNLIVQSHSKYFQNYQSINMKNINIKNFSNQFNRSFTCSLNCSIVGLTTGGAYVSS